MNKRTVLMLGGILGIIILGILILNPFKQKSAGSTPGLSLQQEAEITPSKTLKTYTDASGFSFNYPDNLSLLNNELKDENSYAELQLTAIGIPGSLVLKIADSKPASLDEWVKDKNSTAESPKEMTLGDLKALQIKSNDKLLLGALDQGILFTIEIPQKNFWVEVLNKVAADFFFTQPSAGDASTGDGSSSDVTFDGEEVVE